MSTETQQQPAGKTRKRRRIFLWFFLAVQAIFLIWLISALATSTAPSAHDIAQMCGHGAWQGLWKSYSDCARHSGLTAAGDVGKGIATGLIIGLWVAADVILGVSYGVYRLARRH